jgi:hypothetical protein
MYDVGAREVVLAESVDVEFAFELEDKGVVLDVVVDGGSGGDTLTIRGT